MAFRIATSGRQAEDDLDSALSREEWQQRVVAALRRSGEFVASAPVQSPEEQEREASGRAISDPSLQQGDIISTEKGFVVFVGKGEEHKPGDFQQVPLPHPRARLRGTTTAFTSSLIAFASHRLHKA
jgi:hypothetical protein